MGGKEGKKGQAMWKERVVADKMGEEKLEEARKRGRKTNVETLTRERNMSEGSVGKLQRCGKERYTKRKRGKGKGEEEKNHSKRVERYRYRRRRK